MRLTAIEIGIGLIGGAILYLAPPQTHWVGWLLLLLGVLLIFYSLVSWILEKRSRKNDVTPCQQFQDFLTAKLLQLDEFRQSDESTWGDLRQWWRNVSRAILTALGEALFAGDDSQEWRRQKFSARKELIRLHYRLLAKNATYLYDDGTVIDRDQLNGHFQHYRQQIERLRNEVLPEDLIPSFDPRDLQSFTSTNNSDADPLIQLKKAAADAYSETQKFTLLGHIVRNVRDLGRGRSPSTSAERALTTMASNIVGCYLDVPIYWRFATSSDSIEIPIPARRCAVNLRFEGEGTIFNSTHEHFREEYTNVSIRRSGLDAVLRKIQSEGGNLEEVRVPETD